MAGAGVRARRSLTAPRPTARRRPAPAAQIYEKKVKLVTAINTEGRGAGGGGAVLAAAAGGGAPLSMASLRMPTITPHDVIVTAMPKRVYANGHAYHINSIGTNCDGETFLSADDLRINLWHLASTDVCFNIVDIKPADMEDLSEVITGAEFHPSACALFAYSSSKGSIRLGDMRQRALCDTHAKVRAARAHRPRGARPLGARRAAPRRGERARAGCAARPGA